MADNTDKHFDNKNTLKIFGICFVLYNKIQTCIMESFIVQDVETIFRSFGIQYPSTDIL